MPLKPLKTFLTGHEITYLTISHSPAYTAQEVAASAHIPGNELAKTVVVKIDGKPLESEFEDLFPGCEPGAMPPFGNLYGMDVYVADSLAEDEEIAFNAGSYTELMKLDYLDFERLVKPKVLHFAARV